MAGGLTSGAGDRAAVTRVTGRQQTVDIDLVRLLEAGDASHDIPLLDGDSIYVEEASFFAVSGEVRNPGRYRFRDGITLEEALAMAGGLTDNASREGIVLTRETQEGTVDLETGSWEGDVGVLQGDRIHVSRRKSRVFYVTGEVGRPGSYSHEENLTVLKAITKAGGFSERASRGRVQIRRETDGGTKVLKKVGNDDPVLPEDVIVVPESFF
jgi:polysaccharide export outer membrane protein